MVRKTLVIDGKEYEFAANGVTPIIYKQIFKSDLLKTFQGISENGGEFYEPVTGLAYVMNKTAEGFKYSEMTYDNYFEWLAGFSSGAFLNEDTDAEIIDIWTSSETTNSIPKK